MSKLGVINEKTDWYKKGQKVGFEMGIFYSIAELSRTNDDTRASELLNQTSGIKRNIAFSKLEDIDKKEILSLIRRNK